MEGHILNYSHDGPVNAVQLDEILTGLVDMLAESIATVRRDNEALRNEVKALRRELDTERRLRLSMRR